VALAETYGLIARRGSEAFYQGPLARAMVEAVQRPPVAPGSGLKVRPGLLTMDDLACYQVQIRAPIESTYREYTIYGMAPPSSGGLTVALTLNLQEGCPLGSLPRAQALHHCIEASRLAFADRDAYVGDPDRTDVPVSRLLSKTYAAARRREIRTAPSSGQVSAGAPNGADASTTHLTVADREGNIVSYTFSIGSIGGSGIVVPGHGFLLNSELTDFDPDPAHPNAPGAGKRPRSSMSPTIVFKNRRPVVALGAAGGIAIIASVLQPLINMLDFGLSLQEAIAAPRIFQHNTTVTLAEPGFLNTPEANALRTMGHAFTQIAETGEVTGIAFSPNGTVTAAAEPVRRRGGSASVEEPG
jgi:gamma-glutamyltranspeptidase/glutathione hydrolase